MVSEDSFPVVHQFVGGYSGFGDDFLSASSAISDEFYYGNTFTSRQAADSHNLQPSSLGNTSHNAFSRLQQARLTARRALAQTHDVRTPGTAVADSSTRSTLRAIEGYVYLTLSEGWCGAVPFSVVPDTGTLDPSVIEGGATGTTGSTALRSDNSPAAATNADADGLPFRDAMDPRVPTTYARNCFTSSIRCFYNNNYTDYDSDVPFATGVEARLIESEVALQAGDTATFFKRLNDLRAVSTSLLATCGAWCATTSSPRSRPSRPAPSSGAAPTATTLPTRCRSTRRTTPSTTRGAVPPPRPDIPERIDNTPGALWAPRRAFGDAGRESMGMARHAPLRREAAASRTRDFGRQREKTPRELRAAFSREASCMTGVGIEPTT